MVFLDPERFRVNPIISRVDEARCLVKHGHLWILMKFLKTVIVSKHDPSFITKFPL